MQMGKGQKIPIRLSNRVNYDSPWKKALEVNFKECIHFFFPEMSQDVDWSREHLFLDNRQIDRRFQVSFDSVYPFFIGFTTEQIEELGERFIESKSLDEIRGWADELRERQ